MIYSTCIFKARNIFKMNENTKKHKIVYSRNEKIVRIITIIGILLSFSVGILLFPIGKPTGGIIVLSASVFAAFLVSGFITRRIKSIFGNHKYKKLIFAITYGIIITISMLTAVLVSFFSTFPIDDMAEKSIQFTEEKLALIDATIKDVESNIIHFFESGDSYYFFIETEFKSVDVGGAVANRSSNSYIVVNKFTGTVSPITSLEYDIALSYQ